MAAQSLTRVSGNQCDLDEYELRQVCAIAAWKGERPGITKRLAQRVAGSLGKLSGKLIPDAPVHTAMNALNNAAGKIAKDDSIFKDKHLRLANVRTLEEIAAQPLEFCDQLADRIIGDAGRIALGMGAATGAGGPVSTAVGIPALLFGALRVIHEISQAYGYAVDGEEDRQMMIGILSLSLAATPEQKARALDCYRRQIETSFINHAMEESANKALQRAVLGAELGSLIPGFNIAFNAYLNQQFVSRAGVAAKRVFQERWLRERGKVTWIAPV